MWMNVVVVVTVMVILPFLLYRATSVHPSDFVHFFVCPPIHLTNTLIAQRKIEGYRTTATTMPREICRSRRRVFLAVVTC